MRVCKQRASAPKPQLKSRPEGGLLGRARASRSSRPGWAAALPLSASIRVFLSGLSAALAPTACQRLSDPCPTFTVLYALACIFFSLIPLAAFIAHSAQRFAALGPQLLTSPKHCKAPWVGQYSGQKCLGGWAVCGSQPVLQPGLMVGVVAAGQAGRAPCCGCVHSLSQNYDHTSCNDGAV